MRTLIDLWSTAVADFQDLVAGLTEEDWHRPTDLAGWDVAAVVAHVAHLESVQAGTPHDPIEIGTPAHVAGPMSVFTEQGVVARRERTRDELLAEIATSVAARSAELAEGEPVPDDPAPTVFGMIGWTNQTLLRNRPFDIWMHEQDIRRAVDRPGGLDSPAADYVTGYLQKSLGFVAGKKAGATAGQSVRLEVTGSKPAVIEVGEDGRGRPAEVAEPTTTIRLDREAYIVLAGGRRSPEQVEVAIEGDRELGQRVVAALGVTP